MDSHQNRRLDQYKISWYTEIMGEVLPPIIRIENQEIHSLENHNKKKVHCFIVPGWIIW